MIIEQVDAFKTWLTAVLKPMCEADPAALAKYVLALIKKDKSEVELRKSMVGQLEVFLEGETENFVNQVFQTLTSKDYITTPVIPNANPPNPNIPTPPKPKDGKDTKVIVQPSELPDLNDVNGNTTEKKEPKKLVKSRRNSENAVSTEGLARAPTALPPSLPSNIPERDDRPPRRRSRHRSLSRNRSKSRSRSWDRNKRSKSREKSRERVDREPHRVEREKRDRDRVERDRIRPWRNKSPGRRYDRRRSRTRSPSPVRIRSRSRSPRHGHRSRFRGSRSRSRSLEKRDRKDTKDSKNQSSPTTTSQDANHTDSEPGSGLPSNLSKRRCRDFDEKGYCMKGEMCPYDHGVDPVVLEDTTLSRVLSYNANGDVAGALSAGGPLPGVPLPPGAHPPPVDNPYNPQAPQMWSGNRFRGPRPMGGVRLPGMNQFAPHQPPPNLGFQRELIPVPVVMDNTKPPGVMPPGGYAPVPPYGPPGAAPPQNYGPGGIPVSHPGLEGATMHTGMYKRKFDYNRLGPRKNMANCSLELKKVPIALNNITNLNNHFSKFGKIVNIQVNYEGDVEGALITFSNHGEAVSAYRSTEAVLNNRFIKVFWHDADGNKQENVPPAQQGAVKDRLGGPIPPNSNKVLNLVQPKAGETENGTEKDEAKPELSKEETKAQETADIKKNQDLLAAQVKMIKSKDEQRKEVLKIQSDLRKRKQELLDKQLSQQKVLLDKMAKLPPGPQRDIVKETIKKTQESIEGIKKDLENAALAIKTATVGTKMSKEDIQKELLDMELDLMAKQQEGADTTELQRKMAELKSRAATLGKTAAVRGRGRGRFTPVASWHLLSKNNLVDNNFKLGGKIKTVNKIVNNVSTTAATPPLATALGQTQPTTAFQKHTVDHRPTRILVSGYEMEEQEAVLSHFQQFGEVAEYSIDTSLPSISLNYKTRKEAETALLKGKHFQDRTLSITWQSGAAHRLQTQRSGGSSTRTVLLSESDEDHLIDQSLLEGDDEVAPETEEALLQDDEDEDEEDRSWRR